MPSHSRLWTTLYRRGPRWTSTARRILIERSHRHCTVRFDGPVYLGPGFRLEIPDGGTFLVGPACSFRQGFVCEIVGDGRVVIGAGSTFTYGGVIQCSTSIEIGERATFGQDVLIADGNHRFRDPAVHLLEQGYDFRPITIGRGATVMTKCTVINDLGEGCVIGANSVVTRPIPPRCLAFGAPARVVEHFVAPATESSG
ncbi:hypothetical protein BH24ACT3_BH24ACT3_05800 [soil metagenome]